MSLSTPGDGASSPDGVVHPRGKIRVCSPEEGGTGTEWAHTTGNAVSSTVHPPNLTRTCFEPGIEPRNKSGTFLPMGGGKDINKCNSKHCVKSSGRKKQTKGYRH